MFKQLIYCSLLSICLLGCLNKKKVKKKVFDSVSEDSIRQEVFSENFDQEASFYEVFCFNQKNFKNDPSFLQYVQQQESRFLDIPVPLNMKPLPEFFTKDFISISNSAVLGYFGSMSYKNAVQYYKEEMDYLGWENKNQFIGYEALLHFKKPGKICFVSIRPYDYKKHRGLKKIKILLFISIV